jgi:transcriptional regulator of met regulon
VYFTAGRSRTPPVDKLSVIILYELLVILTNQRTDEKAYIARKSKIAEGSCLCMFRAIFAKHSPNGDDSTSKNSRNASSNYHLQ